MGYRVYPKYERKRNLQGIWVVSVQTSKNVSPRILFQHTDKGKAKRYEELHREGRIR